MTATYRTRTGHSLFFAPHENGVLVEMEFAHVDGRSTGGGAAIGRTRAEAERLASEILAEHERGRKHG